MRRFLLAALLSALAPTFAAAQGLTVGGAGAPVAEHVRKNSSQKFNLTQKTRSGVPISTLVMEYNGLASRLPPGSGTTDTLPPCTESNVRREIVIADETIFDLFDILFYDYHDNSQVRQAAAWYRPTAPWLEGDLYNPYRDKKDFQQSFGRLFRIRCLPTRVHYVTVEGERMEEYREGPSAWVRDDPE